MAVRFLQDVGRTDIDQAGGKASNLGELLSQGFPVPPGFVVCADAYRDAIAAAGRHADARTIRHALLEGDIPAALGADILAAHRRLVGEGHPHVVCAVRSSATAEDLGDASFAGQHATYYHVTEAKLLEMIRNCWASLWSDAARSYRTSRGMSQGDVAMAVIVQRMIPAEVSGVTFTANPVTGDGGEIVTDATWGMGAAIVDGRVTPDHFAVERAGLGIREKRIAAKKLMVSGAPAAGEGRMSAVPFHQRHVACLGDAQIVEATRWGIRAEAHFGAPQDVEWAIHGGRYYLLQSRPITIMGAEAFAHGETRKLVLFKPAAENFTGPVLPLTRDSMPPGMKWVRGRLYGDLFPIKLLLPIRLSDAQAAQLACIEMPEDFTIRIDWLKLPLTLLAWFCVYLCFGLIAARTRGKPDDFMEPFRGHLDRVEADESLSPRAVMMKLFNGAGPFAPCGQRVIWINIAAVPRYVILMGILNRLLRRWIPDLGRDAGSLLCSGSDGVLSADMGRWIFRLSRTARAVPAVSACIGAHDPDAMLDALAKEPAAAGFLGELAAFLRVHGHRALKEFEMASARFEEDPAPVLAMVKNYLGSDADLGAMERHAAANRARLAASVKERLARLPLESALGWRWRVVDYLARRARYFIKLRENSRFYHIMAWYAARRRILRAERSLLAAGRLKIRDDIFYLRWAEVAALETGDLGWVDVEERIRVRRMEIIRWSKLSPPKAINVELPAVERAGAHAGEIRGQGASPGTCEGIARVILDPGVDAALEPGEILVAPYTDPAWTPLFLTARAAVVEVGSYLSHAGTIAREYGMPCVVDAADCTRRIRTGERIRVDGTHGIVRTGLAERPAG